MRTTEITYQETTVRPVFGGKKIEVIYVMTHKKNGFTNEYRVTCEIEGIQSHDLRLSPSSAEFIGDMENDSNEETLTESAALELFEEAI